MKCKDTRIFLLTVMGMSAGRTFCTNQGETPYGGITGLGSGRVIEDSVARSIAEDVVLQRYPTTGTRISQATSQAFSLEAEEEAAVTREETEEMEAVLEELLDLMRD